MKVRSLHPIAQVRNLTTIAILALTLTLSACAGRLPGPEPIAQPVAVVVNQSTPSITLSPPNGYAGLYVQVTGAGWPPNMMVVVVLSDPSGISTTVATKDTDREGSLSTGFLYPIDTRWLLKVPYTVSAESADGQYQASAQFVVLEPGTEISPTTIATSTPEAAATPTVEIAPTVTTMISVTSTPAPTATSTVEVAIANTPTPVASADNQPPLVSAAFVPDKDRGKAHEQFTVEITASDPEGRLHTVMAVLQIPLTVSIEDIKLKVKDKIEIKMDKGKVEISAPDPQAFLDSLQQQGGLEVQPGQHIEYKSSPENKFKIKFEDELLNIESSALLLQVTAVDDAGLSSQITASLPTVSKEEDNRGRGHEDQSNKDKDNEQGEDD